MARIELAAPTHIKLYDTLPVLSQTSTFLTPQQFEEMENITFCEGVVTSEEFSVPLPEHHFSIQTEMILSQIEQLQREPQNYIALANMGEMGLGAFANRKILPGTVVGYYSGEVTPPTYENQTQYSVYLEKGDVQLVINPQNVRGLTNYIQHLPNLIETNSGVVSNLKFQEKFLVDQVDFFKKDFVANIEKLVRYAETTIKHLKTFQDITTFQKQLLEEIQQCLPFYQMVLEKGTNHPHTIAKWMPLILKLYPLLSQVSKEHHWRVLDETIPAHAVEFLEKLETGSFQVQKMPSEMIKLKPKKSFTSFTKIDITNPALPTISAVDCAIIWIALGFFLKSPSSSAIK